MNPVKGPIMAEQAGNTPNFKYLGKPRPLIDGLDKVTGHVTYVADVTLPNMLYMKPILSDYAHARILGVHKEEALALAGVVAVLSAGDLPTRDKMISSRNSAVLAKDKVLFAGQPVAVVVAESEAAAADAAGLVYIDYEPLPAVVSLEDAMRPEAPAVWPEGLPSDDDDMSDMHADTVKGDAKEAGDKPNNVSSSNHYERGDLERGFAEADVVIERRYKTNLVHQAYLENHAVVADPDPLGRGITLYTSTQGQYAVRDIVAKLLDFADSQVTVKTMTVGGGFGAKYGIYEPLVASVALALSRPVKMVLSRSEDFRSTTPAPAIIIELKTGAKKDGSVTALQARVMVDNGVFSFHHGGIVATLLGGYYRWPNLKIDAYEVHTHKLQVGAYRAPGAPQATFAIESSMDDLARGLALDPLEFRLKNAVEGGDPNGTNELWPEGIGLKKVLQRLREHPLWQTRRPGEGVGVAVGGWPTAAGSAEALCRVDSDGSVRVSVGTVDISGVNSGFALVVAETMGVSPDQVVIEGTGTDGAYGPASGGSQITYSTAGAVQQAVHEAKGQLIKLAAEMFEAAEADIDIVEGQAQVKGVPDKTIPLSALVKRGRRKLGGIVAEGRARPPQNAPGFVAHLIKVDVDKATGVVTPRDYVTVQDVGFAINPLLLEGQMHGGAVQGLGLALHEAMVFDESGQLLTTGFFNYSLPRSDNVPRVEAIFVENPSPHGPFGARGIGEPPITAGPAAVANAIKDATGARITELPIRQETLWRALRNQEGAA